MGLNSRATHTLAASHAMPTLSPRALGSATNSSRPGTRGTDGTTSSNQWGSMRSTSARGRALSGVAMSSRKKSPRNPRPRAESPSLAQLEFELGIDLGASPADHTCGVDLGRHRVLCSSPRLDPDTEKRKGEGTALQRERDFEEAMQAGLSPDRHRRVADEHHAVPKAEEPSHHQQALIDLMNLSSDEEEGGRDDNGRPILMEGYGHRVAPTAAFSGTGSKAGKLQLSDAPPVGHYRPRYELVQRRTKCPIMTSARKADPEQPRAPEDFTNSHRSPRGGEEEAPPSTPPKESYMFVSKTPRLPPATTLVDSRMGDEGPQTAREQYQREDFTPVKPKSIPGPKFRRQMPRVFTYADKNSCAPDINYLPYTSPGIVSARGSSRESASRGRYSNGVPFDKQTTREAAILAQASRARGTQDGLSPSTPRMNRMPADAAYYNVNEEVTTKFSTVKAATIPKPSPRQEASLQPKQAPNSGDDHEAISSLAPEHPTMRHVSAPNLGRQLARPAINSTSTIHDLDYDKGEPGSAGSLTKAKPLVPDLRQGKGHEDLVKPNPTSQLDYKPNYQALEPHCAVPDFEKTTVTHHSPKQHHPPPPPAVSSTTEARGDLSSRGSQGGGDPMMDRQLTREGRDKARTQGAISLDKFYDWDLDVVAPKWNVTNLEFGKSTGREGGAVAQRRRIGNSNIG